MPPCDQPICGNPARNAGGVSFATPPHKLEQAGAAGADWSSPATADGSVEYGTAPAIRISAWSVQSVHLAVSSRISPVEGVSRRIGSRSSTSSQLGVFTALPRRRFALIRLCASSAGDADFGGGSEVRTAECAPPWGRQPVRRASPARVLTSLGDGPRHQRGGQPSMGVQFEEAGDRPGWRTEKKGTASSPDFLRQARSAYTNGRCGATEWCYTRLGGYR